MSKIVKLVFKPAKSHKTHNDEWNLFTKEGQVGAYPEEVADQKLADFPNNFSIYRGEEKPKAKAMPMEKGLKEDKLEEPKKVGEEPDKALKTEKTKSK